MTFPLGTQFLGLAVSSNHVGTLIRDWAFSVAFWAAGLVRGRRFVISARGPIDGAGVRRSLPSSRRDGKASRGAHDRRHRAALVYSWEMLQLRTNLVCLGMRSALRAGLGSGISVG